ncbi:MAG: riboflavin synthase [Planctomycetota bacterium]
MFTGIVQTLGRVTRVERAPSGARLGIDLGSLAEDTDYRESVCVSGACLTVAARAGTECLFDVIAETLSRTTLGKLRPGDRVNIELALRAGDPLGGHFVLGHVDATGTIERPGRAPEAEMHVRVPPALVDEIVPKGSIAVDGVSLTVVDVTADSFSCALVPTTLDETTLGSKRPGDDVNVETDILGKHVLRVLRRPAASGALTLEKLRESGFA